MEVVMENKTLMAPAEQGWIPIDQNELHDRLKFNPNSGINYPDIFISGNDTFATEQDAVCNLLSILGTIHAGIAVPDWILFGMAISYLCEKYGWPKELDLNDLGDYLTSKY